MNEEVRKCNCGNLFNPFKYNQFKCFSCLSNEKRLVYGERELADIKNGK